MKLTLDRMCIQTGNLCHTCQTLIDNKEISQIDIDIGKILLNLAKSNKYLSDLSVIRIIPTKNNVFIIVKKGQLDKMKRADDQIKQKLDSLEKRRLVYLEKTKSAKTLIDTLLAPVKVISNSTVIIPPDGTKELKIQIKQNDKSNMIISPGETSKLTNALLGMETHFVYV